MGEFLVAGAVIFLGAFAMWFFFFSGRIAQAKRDAETLPDDPYARRQTEIERLRRDHAEARAENVTHPARRP